ncbi:MAG: PAS domain S-box protein, partial [Gammaproteobacteria bacterium]
RSASTAAPASDAGDRHDEVRSLIEANPDALVITDPLGVITDVNRRMCAITGRGREELIGTPFATHCAHPAVATAVVRSALVEGGVVDRELRLRARDGREPTVAFSAGRLTGADGALRGLVAVARDIAPRKRLEEQLRQRNAELTETTALLDNVLQSSTEYSIIAQDLQGLILTWNEGARRLFGYSAEEVVGKGNAAWLHTPEDLAGGRVQAFLDQAFATGKAEAVFDRRRKSGRRVPTSMSATLRRSADGRPIGYLLIATDLSEQKRLEEELRRKNEALAAQYRQIAEASRQKSAFLAHMSHELRTPLNAIIGFSELLFGGRAGTLQEKHRAFVGDILTSAQHLLQLIDDVLDLSKVEAGRMEFVAEAVDLERVVGEVCEVVGSLVSRHRMRLSVELDPRVNRVVADAGKLRQVLYNYLSNAIKFSPEGSTVVIRTRPEERRRFRLEVQDQGPGIRPQDMHRLFQEFQRLYADSRGSPGTGLGLALTKRLVEAQGGEVGVHSEHGHGSTFFAVLPMELGAGVVASPLPGAAIEPPQVLVVEGDVGRRAWITSTLTGAGYRIDTAATGAGARALCRERSYDAVAFDVQLPDQSGWELLHGVRALPHHARTPAVALCTGDDGLPSCTIAVSEHLFKPVSDDELEAALRRAGVRPSSSMPLALLDADAAAREQLHGLLSARGYRTVPLASAAALPDLLAREGAQALIADFALLQSAAASVLDALHELEQARGLPILVCDGRDAPQRVPASGGTDAGARLIAELRRAGCSPLSELEH